MGWLAGWSVFAWSKQTRTWQGKQASLLHYMGMECMQRCIWQLRADEMAVREAPSFSFVYMTTVNDAYYFCALNHSTYSTSACCLWSSRPAVWFRKTEQTG